jgi:hypothetical protein
VSGKEKLLRRLQPSLIDAEHGQVLQVL